MTLDNLFAAFHVFLLALAKTDTFYLLHKPKGHLVLNLQAETKEAHIGKGLV